MWSWCNVCPHPYVLSSVTESIHQSSLIATHSSTSVSFPQPLCAPLSPPSPVWWVPVGVVRPWSALRTNSLVNIMKHLEEAEQPSLYCNSHWQPGDAQKQLLPNLAPAEGFQCMRAHMYCECLYISLVTCICAQRLCMYVCAFGTVLCMGVCKKVFFDSRSIWD